MLFEFLWIFGNQCFSRSFYLFMVHGLTGMFCGVLVLVVGCSMSSRCYALFFFLFLLFLCCSKKVLTLRSF